MPYAWHDLQVDWRKLLVTRPLESATIPSQFVTMEQTMTEAAQKAVKETQKPETFAARAYAAHSAAAPLAPFTLPRRSPRPQDVQIEILFCGVCHSDLHQVRNEWKDVMPTVYPCVPGHEIVGRVIRVGSAVKKFKEGDIAAPTVATPTASWSKNRMSFACRINWIRLAPLLSFALESLPIRPFAIGM